MKLVLTRIELLEAVESYWGRRKTGRQVEVAFPAGFVTDEVFEFEATPIDEMPDNQEDNTPIFSPRDLRIDREWRYSHSEIEASSGGEVALEVRDKVMKRRAKIRAGIAAQMSETKTDQ